MKAAAIEDARYVVGGKQRVTPVIVELMLRPSERPIDFRAGQYVLLGDVDHARTERSYSVASAPRADGSLRLLVTLVPGGSRSGWVHRELQPGSPVLLSGPYGSFLDSEPDQMPVLYLAGGSGIAPVHALAEAALQSGSQRPATLFFSARTAADVIDRERYGGWAKAHPKFQFMCTLTRAAG